MSKEDDRLFEEAMTNLDMSERHTIDDRQDPSGRAPAPGPSRDAEERSEGDLFRDAVASMGEMDVDAAVEEPERSTDPRLGSRRAIERRIRRGELQPDRTVDLHGLTEVQALEATEAALRTSRRRGERVVLVICGRGLHSKGDAVLQRALMRWLKGPLAELVQERYPASAGPGGRGAWFMVLRR